MGIERKRNREIDRGKEREGKRYKKKVRGKKGVKFSEEKGEREREFEKDLK